MIYVHIPYCHSKCAYCDFYSIPDAGSADRMVKAIVREYAMRCHEIPEQVDTIYIGGGTPSILPDHMLEALISALPRPAGEFTIEVNPEDVSAERVRHWREMGINRVSMGVQTLIDTELKSIGRRHTADDAIRAASAIREGGIDNISLDLIYGLPGQTAQSWEYSLGRVLEFRPSHLSAYILSYEPGTRLTAMLHTGKVEQADDSLIEEMYAILCRETSRAGYEHYEISNFALPGRRATHNSGYWHSVPYLGLGPAAHSFDGTIRRINPSSTKDYLVKIESGLTACEIDDEDDNNRFNDLLITRLRTAEGLPLHLVPETRVGQLLRDAAPMLADRRLALADHSLIIPERHWLTSDTIISNLMQLNQQ